MTRRTRALFFASLAVLLGPFALPDGARPAEVVAAPAMEPPPVRHDAHPATYGARSWLPDRPADRLWNTPLAVASRAAPAVAGAAVAAVAPASPAVAAAGPLRLLPPCRGPPELS